MVALPGLKAIDLKESDRLMRNLVRASNEPFQDVSWKVGIGPRLIQEYFVSLLASQSPDVPAFLAGVLHGDYGPMATQVAWKSVINRGLNADSNRLINPGFNPSSGSSAMRISFGAFCVLYGRIDFLRAIVMRPTLPSIPEEIAEFTTKSRADLLELLCNTAHSLRTPGQLSSLVEIALLRHRSPSVLDEALSLAWDVDPDSPLFYKIGSRQDEYGALLRQFLLTKRLANPVDVQAGASIDEVTTRLARPTPRRL